MREKLALILLTALLASLTVSGLLSLRALEQDILDEIDRHGNDTSELIGQTLAYHIVSRDYQSVELILQNLAQGHDIAYARLDNNRGQLVAVAGTPPDNPGRLRHYGREVRLNGEALGRLTLSLSTERIADSLVAHQRHVLAWQTGALVVIMISGFAALSLLIVRPLTMIAGTLRKNLNDAKPVVDRIPLETADEFGDLARGFNALSERLNEAQRKLESRFVASDHDLWIAYEQLASEADMLRLKNEELEQLSLTDHPTGFFNRRYFEQLMETRVSQAVRNDETLSILLIAVDRIKLAGERQGDDARDELTRNVSRTISGHVRKTDVVCRYGNDEYVVLCWRATIANALSIADDLLQGLANCPALAGEGVTANIGIATIPGVHNIASAAGFFECAGEALRHCQQWGRGIALHYSMLERNTRSLSQH